MRVETIGNATLYLGDCLEILPTLPNVAAVVTDPPYGVGYADQEWDQQIPPLLWLDAAILKAETVMVITGTTHMFKYPAPVWTLAWARPGSVQRAKGGGFSHWEPILVYGKQPLDVDCKVFPASTGDSQLYKGEHPCPKPVHVMEWLISGCGDTIMDPFMGSGTTGVACENLGKKFIGIEINAAYFDVACERIRNAQRQERLFA